MAAASTSAPTTQKQKDKAIKAALDLAATGGWGQVSLYDIASEAGLPLSRLFELFDDRFDILAGLGRYIDRKTLEQAEEPAVDLSTRDRLFDLLMDRFEVLNQHRAGVTAILSSFRLDPKQALLSFPHLGRSMSWMLEAAGVKTSGIKGCAKVIGLTGVYIKTLRTWMKDESPDMAATMAALDKNLGRVEQFAQRFGL